jgi:hypothetical protein
LPCLGGRGTAASAAAHRSSTLLFLAVAVLLVLAAFAIAVLFVLLALLTVLLAVLAALFLVAVLLVLLVLLVAVLLAHVHLLMWPATSPTSWSGKVHSRQIIRGCIHLMRLRVHAMNHCPVWASARPTLMVVRQAGPVTLE